VCRVGQVSHIVHGVTIRNIVLGARDCGDSALRGEGTTARQGGVEYWELCGGGKVEVQRHFII
jgi:hypothetical protein